MNANQSLIILGVDPGSQATGFGVIRYNRTEMEFLDCGVIRTGKVPLAQRLQIIFDALVRVIKMYQPDEAAVEEVFMHLNPGGALKLGHARGAALVALATSGISIVAEYPARRVKQAVVGSGAASKDQVQFMVRSLLKLNQPEAHDATDALAVAVCHAHSRQPYQATEVIHPQLQELMKQFPRGWRRGRR
jgi:crossover junction endodeoxyribonuclease RuvC